jgi:LuxR family quorum-sensing system transcriptional regulator CciR
VLTMEAIASVRVRDAAGVRPAALALRRLVEAMGAFRVAPCHDIASKAPMVDAEGAVLASTAFGWSDEEDRWWKRPRIALDSPLTTACRYAAEPFWANAEGFRSDAPNPFLDGIDLSDFTARALTPAAIVAPVHLPFGQVGAVSFTPLDRGLTDLSQAFAAFGDAFGVYARTFVASYVPVMCRAQRLPASSRLSKREVECLRWAAVGKTDDEIGTILDRSRATVRFHIHNASLKLDAVNRSQTVFKAAQLGYFGLNG